MKSSVSDAGLDLCNKKDQIREFFYGRRSSRGGGGYEKNEYMKTLRLELVLVDDLGEKGSLMMKLDQVSG